MIEDPLRGFFGDFLGFFVILEDSYGIWSRDFEDSQPFFHDFLVVFWRSWRFIEDHWGLFGILAGFFCDCLPFLKVFLGDTFGIICDPWRFKFWGFLNFFRDFLKILARRLLPTIPSNFKGFSAILGDSLVILRILKNFKDSLESLQDFKNYYLQFFLILSNIKEFSRILQNLWGLFWNSGDPWNPWPFSWDLEDFRAFFRIAGFFVVAITCSFSRFSWLCFKRSFGMSKDSRRSLRMLWPQTINAVGPLLRLVNDVNRPQLIVNR